MKVKKRSLKSYRVLAFIVLLGAIDIAAKVIIKQIPPNEPVLNNKLLDLMHFQNEGIALSIPLPTSVSILVSAGLILYLIFTVKKHESLQKRLSIGLIVIGALSNLVERIAIGHVTDYLLLFGRAAINIADILIVLGVLGFIRYNKNIS